VSVSAGFALVGIGTENDGSIVQPASRQALYALKPTLGLAIAEGCWQLGFVDPSIWRFPPDLWVPSEEAKEQHVSKRALRAVLILF